MNKPFTIAHAAQDSDPNDSGFVHAVALAAHGGARLVSVHACAAGSHPVELPEASVLLARWGYAADRVSHERIQHTCCDEVDETLLDALAQVTPDLLIASTHARSGIARIFLGSVAEGVARNLRAPTLLLPLGGPSFVDGSSGALRLTRMLLPVGGTREAQAAVNAAAALAQLAESERVELVLLHVTDGAAPPEVKVPAGFHVSQRTATGPLEPAVVQAAQALQPDLIVMVTHGHDAVADVARSSHTERVLHACRRPLLWVPASAA